MRTVIIDLGESASKYRDLSKSSNKKKTGIEKSEDALTNSKTDFDKFLMEIYRISSFYRNNQVIETISAAMNTLKNNHSIEENVRKFLIQICRRLFVIFEICCLSQNRLIQFAQRKA
jgi:hypothetical protein